MQSWRQQSAQQKKEEVELPPEGEVLTADQYRQKHRIQVQNMTDVPDPYQDFEGQNFPQYITDVIRLAGFKSLTPVQGQAMPIIMSGRDFIGISKTGSGKTLAFLIPGVCKMVAEKPKGKGPFILVLSPTRQLAMQIENEFKKFLYKSNFHWACVYGGIKKDFQRHQILRDIQILVATPGRLIDFLQEGSIQLENVCYFVLDEADMMLDMGFSPQIRQIMGHLRKPRQNLMFSATWPFAIRDLAARYLDNAVCLVIGQQERTVNDAIKQEIKILKHREKFDHLQADLNSTQERRLVFVQRKIDCQNISDMLYNKARIESCTIHGDKAQMQRDKALQQFKSGKMKVMIATDVASRGLDIPDVELVINYDFPKQIEDYIHRIGRTGRAGKKGSTISYVVQGEDNRTTQDLVPLLRSAKQVVNQELVDFSKRRGTDKGDKYTKRYNYNYMNPTSNTSLGESWRSNKQATEPKSMKNLEQPLPLRRFESDRGNFKSQKFISKSSKFIQTSKIFHPTIKFTINDVELSISFTDIAKTDVDILIVPFSEAGKDSKSVKKIGKILDVNIADVMKGVLPGQLKESKNEKLGCDLIFFAHTEEHDGQGSYLVYIIDKILKQKEQACEKLGIFEIGGDKYPQDVQCKMVLYALLELLEKNEHQTIKQIKIYCDDSKEFMKYTEALDDIIGGMPVQNLVLEN